MPVDTSIYSNIRPFTMADPLDQAAKATALRGANRQFTMEDDVNTALSESGGDYGKASQALLARGRGTAGMQLQGKADAQKKGELDANLKKMEAIASDGIAMDAAYRQALQANGGDQAKALSAIQPSWSEVRSRWATQGVNLNETFDPVKNLASIGQAKESAAYLKTLNPTYGAPVAGVGPDGKPLFAQPSNQGGPARVIPGVAPRENPTELARLQAERDALPEGDQRRADYDRVISGFKGGRATDITIQQPGPMVPTKPVAGKIDESVLDLTRHRMVLGQIESQFRPEFQTFMTKGSMEGLAMKEKMGGTLTNKQKQDLTDFSKYRRNSINSLNEYIKSITGAAMSETEAQRILKGMPNPGTGLFDGDSPTEFKAKLDDAIRQTNMAVARAAYLKRNGMSLEDGKGGATVPLDRMPTLMNQRGAEIEKELKASRPDSDDKLIQRAVRRQLGIEFGLASD